MTTDRADLGYLIKSMIAHRGIIISMTRRTLALRYKGSLLGILWSFLNPLLMLAVYAFMFLFVFKAKWGTPGGDETKAAFVPVLFTGLIVHAFFAEVIIGGPNLIVTNVNFVKKIVFPLEVLSVISVATALANCLTAWIILVCMQSFLGAELHWTLLYFPLIMLPLAVFCLGMSWVLAAFGVFVRDIAQLAGFATTAALFLSPIFFPVTALPPALQGWMQLNPLTIIVEQSRRAIISGEMPIFEQLLAYSAVAFIFALCGFGIFQKMRKGFADVL